MHASRIVIVGSVSWIISIAIALFWNIPLAFIGICIFGGAFMISRPLVATVLLVIGIGFVRVASIPEPDFTGAGEKKTMTAVVLSTPQRGVHKQKFQIQDLKTKQNSIVYSALQPKIEVDDQLQMSCNLEKPEAFDGFRYDKFLERHRIDLICWRPKIEVVDHKKRWRAPFMIIKKYFQKSFRKMFTPSQSAVLEGMLLGDRSAIPEDILNAYRSTGIAHILVISGLHMNLIITFVSAIAIRIPIRQRTRIFFIGCVIVTYVLMIGAPVSAIRASVMGIAVVAQTFIGRRVQSLRLLLFIAVIMIAINPLILLYDIGFQLSFVATAGIIVLQKRIQKYIPLWVPQYMQELIAVSTAAIITTTPVSIWYFKIFSPIAIIVNAIVVPLVPLILMAGVVTTALVEFTGVQRIALPLGEAIEILNQYIVWISQIPGVTIVL